MIMFRLPAGLTGAGYLLTAIALSAVTAVSAWAQVPPLRIATIGTSLTANGGWQAPLASALEACLRRPVEVDNRSKAGASSDWGLQATGPVADTRPDIVLLEFAANDSAVNRRIGVSDSTANMRAIVQALRDRNPDVIVYIMTMNPFSGLRSWMRPFRDRYENAHRDLAGELGIGYLDHRSAWLARTPDDLYLRIADGVHPSPSAAAAVMVSGILSRLRDDRVVQCVAQSGPSGP